jgi:transcriptional regulator with XRE-family HTH domain
MGIVTLKSPLKATRERQRLPMADAAEALGLSVPELTRLEKSLDHATDAQLRDLAIFYGLNVTDLTGRDPPDTHLHEWPFAIEKVGAEKPYGTLRVGFPWGVREYPIDDGVRGNVLTSIAHCDPQGHDSSTSWLHAWTLDNRLVYLNLDYVEWIDLIGDDEEAMPAFFHPEVYFAVSTLDVEKREDGPVLSQALESLVECYESSDDAIRAARESLSITGSGRELWHHMLTGSDTMAAFTLSLAHDLHMARNALLEMCSEGYYSARHVNLSRMAAIEFPAEEYARLSRDE